MTKVLDLAEAYDTSKFAFVWDSKHSWRKKKYHWYKAKRAKSRKELDEAEKEALAAMFRQVDLIQHILPRIGFRNNLMQNGVEGDDLMAMICRNYPQYKIILVANDHDLYQLLDNKVSMLSPKADYLGKEYKAANFEEEFGISPRKWHLVKAIAGCTSDEVPGVEKVGEKTACKYLRGELKEHTQAYKKITCQDGIDIKERNLELVELPHKKTKPIILQEDELNLEEFKKLCKEFKFKYFLEDRFDEWERFFNR